SGTSMLRTLLALLAFWLIGVTAAQALTPEAALSMAQGDTDERIAAMQAAATDSSPELGPYLRAMADGEVVLFADRAWIFDGEQARDPVSGEKQALPELFEEPMVNNRLRNAIEAVRAGMQLFHADEAMRLRGAQSLMKEPDPAHLALVDKA